VQQIKSCTCVRVGCIMIEIEQVQNYTKNINAIVIVRTISKYILYITYTM